MTTARVLLEADGGARAEVARHGAQVLSWRPAGSRQDRLYLSPRARFGTGHAIRGGIPLLFPQFGLFGPLPKHGLVRTAQWHALPRTAPNEACFGLGDSADTRSLWPFAFELQATISLAPQSLSVSLQVLNRDEQPFTFTAGLHTYLRLQGGAGGVRLVGLADRPYLDALADLRLQAASGVEPPASGTVDRVYLGAATPVTLIDGERLTGISQSGFEDVVVWNPGSGTTVPDLPPADHAVMLCVEAARIGNPVTLIPGGRWLGSQTLRAL